MRRASAAGIRATGTRRRSSANYSSWAPNRRCSLSTFGTSTRIRSNSKGYAAEDDIEFSHPSLEDLPLIAGYEDLSFEPCTIPPPHLPIITEIDVDEPEVEGFKQIPQLSAKEARFLLIRHSDSRCIYNKDAARDMKITSMEYQPRHKYTLESFTEMREVFWSFEAYTGTQLDEFRSTCPVPGPWSLETPVPTPFQVHSTTETVPHTDVLMTCHGCGGLGSKRCNACSAAGWERCSFCLGDGNKISLQGQKERCFRCLGTGRKKCWKCNGDTIAVCRSCEGTGQIKCFISVTITWSNHVDTRTIEPEETVPALGQKLEYAEGLLVFEEEKQLVSPISSPDSELYSLSSALIEQHNELFETEKLISQKHSVCTIPVYCFSYVWRQKTRNFFIYGMKNEVFAPSYPEQICCCQLM